MAAYENIRQWTFYTIETRLSILCARHGEYIIQYRQELISLTFSISRLYVHVIFSVVFSPSHSGNYGLYVDPPGDGEASRLRFYYKYCIELSIVSLAR